MPEGNALTPEEVELNAAIEAVLQSPARKKLVIAGPGTGKTTLFKQILKLATGEPDHRIVLTFINSLKNDLERDLSGLAQVHTLHSFCLGLLYRDASLRVGLSPEFSCFPGLAHLIARDWEIIAGTDAPHFVAKMRELATDDSMPFYLERGDYYDAVDFDDTVYRVYDGLSRGMSQVGKYDLVLIDEYQDFNRLEAGIIDLLGDANPIVIAGDDDQALYNQLRNASWDFIRSLRRADNYEVFELPFCLRCPKVIVDAVSDILAKANEIERLQGRIEKPYRHFPPAKGADSLKYPKIACVEVSVQSKKSNYMGQFIAQEIAKIPEDEIDAAVRGGYPAVLVIVAKPYRDQIIDHLELAGFNVESRNEVGRDLDRDASLVILKENPESNLGWRVILGVGRPPFLHESIFATAKGGTRLVDKIPGDYRDYILAQAEAHNPAEEELAAEAKELVAAANKRPVVRVTSFEGSKGMSAQHIFIAGLHDGELPHDPKSVKDLEICKFVVGLTRTRKKCTLVYTRHFGANWKTRSSFISWINPEHLDIVKVNKAYWNNQPKPASAK